MAVSAYDWIGFHADIRPDSVALIDDFTGKTHTYVQLDERVRRTAAWLAGKGVGEGDRVAFLSENTIDIFEVLFACAHLNAIIVPLNWRLAVPELQFIVGDSRPTVLIYEGQFQEAVDELVTPERLRMGDDYEAALAGADPADAPPVTATHDDPLAIMYTSGTTGHP
jgi:fatty-acyl-CoA synthase